MLWEFMKWPPKSKCFDLLLNSPNWFLKETYGNQFGEFVCEYWGLKDTKGKIKWKKIHAPQLTLKNIHATA